jgi:Protein of unknown function (DUF2480)
MENVLVNRVAESGITIINLEDFFPTTEFAIFDIKDYLFHGMILKEKDFREALKETDWSIFNNKIVLIVCSADAIIPLWAYMLISQYLYQKAVDIYLGSKEDYLQLHFSREIDKVDLLQYKDQRIVIKGCSLKPVPASAYAKITLALKPLALSIMFGEPCSTVPIYKRPRV